MDVVTTSQGPSPMLHYPVDSYHQWSTVTAQKPCKCRVKYEIIHGALHVSHFYVTDYQFECIDVFMDILCSFTGEFSVDDAWTFQELEERIIKGYF